MRRLCAALLLWVTAATPAAAHVSADARGGRAVAAEAGHAAMVAARQRVFGDGNVDEVTGAVRPDRVILSWYGVTNFAMAIRGHVILLDAWVARGANSGYAPVTPEQLAELAPEAILIGHGHFDHAADATPLAQATGAPLVGTGEHCADLQARATTGIPPRCIAAAPAGSAPGTTREVDLLSGVQITAVRHLHSAAKNPDGTDQGGYHVPVLPGPSTTLLDHPPTPQDVAHVVGHAQDAEGGNVLYRFRTGGLSLVWHDTSGPLVEDAPQTFDAFRALRPVDVQVGAIQGFNQITNGLRDPRRYIEALAPKTFIPTHHDDWLIGITSPGEVYRQPLADELARMPAEQRPTVRFITDPIDYLRPISFKLALPDPRLTRRCTGGRLRVRLGGETDLVRSVRFALDRRRFVDDARPPFAATFGRRALGQTRSRRVRATVNRVDGARATLRRPLPRC